MVHKPAKIAVIGFGKIARDEHVAAIAGSDTFTLIGAIDPFHPTRELPAFDNLAAALNAHPDLAAVSVCTPPFARLAIVEEALAAGLDVMIEKPPATTIGQAEAMATAFRVNDAILFAAWHSREAAAVKLARAWLEGQHIRRVEVYWREDIRQWHPGQDWMWQPGAGAFDPGINAFSILTEILDDDILACAGTLRIPENRAAPIAAELQYTHGDAEVHIQLDIGYEGIPEWQIVVSADRGQLVLDKGGAKLSIADQKQAVSPAEEYPRLYQRFAELRATRSDDFDLRPLRMVADAFLVSRMMIVSPFDW